jgi:hypothetical protein
VLAGEGPQQKDWAALRPSHRFWTLSLAGSPQGPMTIFQASNREGLEVLVGRGEGWDWQGRAESIQWVTALLSKLFQGHPREVTSLTSGLGPQ